MMYSPKARKTQTKAVERVLERSQSGRICHRPNQKRSLENSEIEFRQKYHVYELIRNSTNGVIYGAMNKTTGQPVVLKQIKKLPKRGLLSEIPREIQMHKIASTCPSGGCVQMTEWYERKQTYVMVLDRPADSCDLFEYSKMNGPLIEPIVRIIMCQVYSTVVELRKAGITHHDIKDENVLINRKTLECKIIDFGCARQYNTSMQKHLIGTPEFFPPEWYNTRQYTQESATVWSLGCLFYVLLTSRAPFQHIDEIRHADLMINRPIVSQLSPTCADLLNRMLDPNPLQRISLVDLGNHPFWTVPVMSPMFSMPSLPQGQYKQPFGSPQVTFAPSSQFAQAAHTYASPTHYIPPSYTPPYFYGPSSDGSEGSVLV